MTFPDCSVDVLLAILGSVFGKWMTRKHCPWRNPHRKKSHTLSGLVTGVARCGRYCVWPLPDQTIDLVYASSARWQLATVGPFQMLRSLCVITILRHFLLKVMA
jgi:hypothetical protein